MPFFQNVWAVAIGGAVGAVTRVWLTRWIHLWTGSYFPFGTFLINVLGCFLIGYCHGHWARHPGSHWVQYMVMGGFIGALTTFSTFELETLMMWRGKHQGLALLYVFASVCLGFLMVWTGFLLSRRGGWA